MYGDYAQDFLKMSSRFDKMRSLTQELIGYRFLWACVGFSIKAECGMSCGPRWGTHSKTQAKDHQASLWLVEWTHRIPEGLVPGVPLSCPVNGWVGTADAGALKEAFLCFFRGRMTSHTELRIKCSRGLNQYVPAKVIICPSQEWWWMVVRQKYCDEMIAATHRAQGVLFFLISGYNFLRERHVSPLFSLDKKVCLCFKCPGIVCQKMNKITEANKVERQVRSTDLSLFGFWVSLSWFLT